jgi:hypothetical protein
MLKIALFNWLWMPSQNKNKNKKKHSSTFFVKNALAHYNAGMQIQRS